MPTPNDSLATEKTEAVPVGRWWRLKMNLMEGKERRNALARLLLDRTMEPELQEARVEALLEIGLLTDVQSDIQLEEVRENLFRPGSFIKWIGASFSMIFGSTNLELDGYEIAQRQLWRIAWHAMETGRSPAIIELLMKSGLDPNETSTNEYDDTLLTQAVRKGQGQYIGPLVRGGCDIEAMDSVADTPLKIALRGKSDTLPGLLINLLKAGADPNGRGSRRREHEDIQDPPLFVAVEYNNLANTKILIEKGADVNAVGRGGNGILHWASTPKKNGPNLIAYLIEQGANLEQVDATGATPIAQALFSSNLPMVAQLIEAGANIQARDNRFKEKSPNASLLHHLVTMLPPCDEALAIVRTIEEKDPKCWQWTDGNGRTPSALIQRRILKDAAAMEVQWLAIAEESEMRRNTKQAPASERKGLRL